jgi:beta-galactosidase
MAASAVHFRVEDNYTDRNNRVKHTYDFKTCSNTIVSLDAATRGLGNASCGPDVMDKYELKAKNTEFRFMLVPFDKNTKPATVARVSMPVAQSVDCHRLSNGRITMSTKTPNASIYYSIDGGEWKKYSTIVAHNDACTIRAYATADGLLDSPTMSYDLDLYINKAAWRLISADSQHSGNEATKAFDNNTSTFWHTEYSGSEPTCPHTLIIDMRKTYEVTAFTYTARTDGEVNGMVKQYEVYLSNDNTNWGSPVVSGEFQNTTSQQVAKLATPTRGRYLKFVALSEINGRAWTSASEVGIQATADVTAITAPDASALDGDTNYYSLNGAIAPIPTPGNYYVHQGKTVFKK